MRGSLRFLVGWALVVAAGGCWRVAPQPEPTEPAASTTEPAASTTEPAASTTEPPPAAPSDEGRAPLDPEKGVAYRVTHDADTGMEELEELVAGHHGQWRPIDDTTAVVTFPPLHAALLRDLAETVTLMPPALKINRWAFGEAEHVIVLADRSYLHDNAAADRLVEQLQLAATQVDVTARILRVGGGDTLATRGRGSDEFLAVIASFPEVLEVRPRPNVRPH